MYQGIEISHPIYSLLFSNLIVAFVATSVNLIVLIVFPFNVWIRFSLYGNVFSTHFHLTSWSIISVLRYFYIEHKEWIESKWPDPKQLRPIALAAVFSSYAAITSVDLGLFAIFATPYGWPTKSFIKHVPRNVQLFLIPCSAILFTLPVFVSGIFYVLLVCSRSSWTKKSSKTAEHVRAITTQENPKLDFHEELKGGSFQSEIQTTVQDDNYDNQSQNETSGSSFEYNAILKQSGQPYNEYNGRIVNHSNEMFVCHGYFGVRNIKPPETKNTCFQNNLPNNNMCERGKKETMPEQQKNNIIHVRETNQELKISAQHLTERNEMPSRYNNFNVDDIEVDPTFRGSRNSTTIDIFNIPITHNDRLTDQRNSVTNSSISSEKLVANRQEAERVSAMRSLKTNLIMILLVFMSNFVLLIPSKIWQTYFCIVDTSIQKALLPIITTMANFGTVRSVASQFWKAIYKT